MKIYSDINNAIIALNHAHGIGDVKAVRRFADDKLEVDIKPYSMRLCTRKGRIVCNGLKQTIFLFRHQLTVKVIK